jgi:hypothetical protein
MLEGEFSPKANYPQSSFLRQIPTLYLQTTRRVLIVDIHQERRGEQQLAELKKKDENPEDDHVDMMTVVASIEKYLTLKSPEAEKPKPLDFTYAEYGMDVTGEGVRHGEEANFWSSPI